MADCEATLARVALEPGWQEAEHAQWTLRAQTVLAQGREIMLAGDALRSAMASQTGAANPQTLAAVRSTQEQASAGLNRYADALAASPPDARAPRRSEIAAQAVEAADRPLVAAADELSRQVAGLPDWRAEVQDEASIAAPSSRPI